MSLQQPVRAHGAAPVRGVCPGLAQPLETGDGLLARIAADAFPTACEAWQELCAAACEHGSGWLAVTARGSLQVRGLRPAAARAFAQRLAELGARDHPAPQLQVGPLAGQDPTEWLDAAALAAALRAELRGAAGELRGLAPKTSIALDGGGALHLDALESDLRLRAGPGGGLQLFVGPNHAPAALGAVLPGRELEALLRLCAALAARGRAHEPLHGEPGAARAPACAGRARELLRREGPAVFAQALAGCVRPAPPPPPRPPAQPLGAHALRAGRHALGLGLAFGRCSAAALRELIEAAAALGASGLRACAPRSLLVLGLLPQALEPLAHSAWRLGFATSPHDPRRSVIACPGAPACSGARTPALELAPQVAAAAAPLLDGSLAIHLSGCAKGCAHPAPAALAFVGSGAGRLELVVGGAALGSLRPEQLAPGLARLAGRAQAQRAPGEAAAAVLRRIGARAVAQELGVSAHG